MQELTSAFLAVLISVATMDAAFGSESKSRPDTVGALGTVFKKEVSLDGSSYEITVVRDSIEVDVPNNAQSTITQQWINTTVFMKLLGNSGNPNKRIWWLTSLVPSEGVVSGTPVFDVCLCKEDEKLIIWLGLGNSYYHYRRIVKIDASREVSPPSPPVTRVGATGTTELSPHSDSELGSFSVPDENTASLYGTKALKISCEGDGVALETENATGKKDTLRFDYKESKWTKAAVSVETPGHTGGQ